MKLEVIISSIGVILVAVSGILLWYQIRSNHEWARRKATHDLLMDVVSGNFRQMRRRVDEKVDPYEPKETYSAMTSSGEFTELDTRNLIDVLNYLETVAISVKHDVLD